MEQELHYLVKGDNGYSVAPQYEEQLKSIDERRKALDKEEAPIKSGIKKEAKIVCPVGANLGYYNYTVSSSYITLEVDIEKLRKEYPQVYKSCLKAVYKSGCEKIAPCQKKKGDK